MSRSREVVWLWHVTHKTKIGKINREGLRVARSEGSLKRIWLAEGTKLTWALEHVAKHHNWPLEQMAFFLVGLPKDFLLAPIRQGIWTSYTDIGPDLLDRSESGNFLFNELS